MYARRSHRAVLLALLSSAMLAGCSGMTGGKKDPGGDIGTTSTNVRIPKDAELVSQGRGELSHKARLDGRIWLRDATAERDLFTTPVRRGQRFTIAPGEDRASLDGADVFEGNMQTRNEHQIYYLPKR